MVWMLIKNVPQLLAHIPGAAFAGSAGALDHSATFTIAGGPSRGTYSLRVVVDSLDDSTRTAVVNVTGESGSAPGGLRGTIRAAVQPFGIGSSIAIHADVDAPGMQVSTSSGSTPGGPPPEFTNAANQFAANLQKMFQR